MEVAAELKRQIRAAVNLTASLGVARGKMLAKIASDRSKPDGLLAVAEGREAEFLAGLPVSALWALAAPATQAMITRQVGPQVQGRIQGALMSLTSVAGIVGPMLFANVFALFVGSHAPAHLPGAPWFVAALLLACAWGVGWRYARVANPS
jgi:MFS family permease